MMRVLWFSNTPAAGDDYISSNGTGGWLKSLDRALQDKVELHVAFYDRRYPSEFKVGKTTYHQLSPKTTKGLIIRRVKLFFGNNPDLSVWKDLIDSVKPDIIHIHGTEQPWILIAKHTNVPILLSIQAILTVLSYKYYSGIEKDYLPFRSSYKEAYRSFIKKSYIEQKNLKYINNVMGRTDWDRRVYSVLAPHAHYYFGGEILRDSFYKSQWVKPSHGLDVIIVHTTTGAHLFKGLETICMSVAILTSIGINVDWRVAGVTDNCDFVKIIKNKIGKKYPDKGLTLLGLLDEQKLVEKMLEADVFVSPSHQDNSPNSLCEAMLLGMPCVSTYAGGSGSILKDGQTGILVQDGDPWVLAGAVLELASNNDLALKYANNARTEAIVRHNKENVVSQMLETYQHITG